MSDQDKIWRDLAGLGDPTPESMAEAEAALRELPPSPPLSPAEVERILASSGVEAPAAPARGARGRLGTSARLRSRRKWLVAGTVMLAAALAAPAIWRLWPEQQRGHATLDFERAVLLTQESGIEDAHRLNGIEFLMMRCQPTIMSLAQLAADSDRDIAEKARQIRAELVRELETARMGPRAAEIPPGDYIPPIPVAEDRQAPLESRLAALDEVKRFLSIAIRAVAVCRVDTPGGIANRDVYVDNLRRMLQL